MEDKTPRNGRLVFAVNGERFELEDVHPSTTLLEFLRGHTRFKSVKLGCGEGGCGACVVLLSKYNPLLEKLEQFTVSSCLTLVCSINKCAITTSEGLGNSKDGFHPIHKRFACFHASQCGFCTPGMSMSLFSSLVNAEETDRQNPPASFSKLTASEAEKSIAGNLCRCTGYRPIADACKSFASDADIEDLGVNCFWRKEEDRDVKIGRLASCHPSDLVCTYPDSFKNEKEPPLNLDSKCYSWHSPVTVQELICLLKSAASENEKTKLVVGNTGTGYYKELAYFNRFIDLRCIPELSTIKRDRRGFEIGAAVTISNVISSLRHVDDDDNLVFCRISDHMDKIASHFVRNSASIGGNLVMAQRKSFPSDIATLLLAVGSTVAILSRGEIQNITMDEFLGREPLDSQSVLLSIRIPSRETNSEVNSAAAGSKLMFETYRAAPRPLGNALPYLNAAFLANVSSSNNGILVNGIRLAFGAYGTKHAIRAKKVEKYLTGKVMSIGVLYDAVRLLKEVVVPEDGTSHPMYRSSLAVSYLFEFFHRSLHVHGGIVDGLSNHPTDSYSDDAVKAEISSSFGQTVKSPLLHSAKQVLNSSKAHYPIGEPMTKYGAALQASGEAVYVDDIPSPPNCLHGAFIYSTKPVARIKSVDFRSTSLPGGVTAVMTYKDIPAGGRNIGSKIMLAEEPLFANDITRCAGERIAFVVADTQKHADTATNLALVDYDTDNLDPPILTVEEAVERSSFFDFSNFFQLEPVGDISKGMAEADHKILSAKVELGSQYFFYMENQTALAVPDEDNCLDVYSSIQNPEYAQIVIAECLGIPKHNVRVITRRLGGGFGGKASKAMPIATACALAAYTLRRPVRTYLNRKTDMIMAGGRHPIKITYSVGFMSSGKITAVDLDILIDAGTDEDFSPYIPQAVINNFMKYDWGALNYDIKLCKTNNPSRTMMRAPGDVQGSYFAEAIIEHVASTLQMDADSVRNINLHTFESLRRFYGRTAGSELEYTLPTIWDKLIISSSFVQRRRVIEQFNQQSIWRKRGISRLPIVYALVVRSCPGKVSILWDGSIVVEVGGIEMGQGLWTKVRQVTAYALSLVDCDGTENLVEKIRVIQADTLSLIQGGMTTGSTTSESSCEAVRLCCNILVERLAPLKKQIQDEMGNVDWDTLILQANLKEVNLAANNYYVPDLNSKEYLSYGAAVSEVEVNILTGQTKILQSDIIYDCGQSVNPAVDLGQIEGCFVQGIGFFMLEEYLSNREGLVVTDSTWTYKIPTIDTIPQKFNVEIMNSKHHQKRTLSAKASGEPPLLLSASVHCATRAAITAARKQLNSWSSSIKLDLDFQLDVPATMPVVKGLCGLDSVEKYLEKLCTQ